MKVRDFHFRNANFNKFTKYPNPLYIYIYIYCQLFFWVIIPDIVVFHKRILYIGTQQKYFMTGRETLSLFKRPFARLRT